MPGQDRFKLDDGQRKRRSPGVNFQALCNGSLKHAGLVARARFSSSKAALERRIEGEALNQQYFLDLVLNTSSLNVLKK